MYQPEAFLKYKEAWHPVVSMLASQIAITISNSSELKQQQPV
jgi:hypothetical protein